MLDSDKTVEQRTDRKFFLTIMHGRPMIPKPEGRILIGRARS
jgi:hypothetical protein